MHFDEQIRGRGLCPLLSPCTLHLGRTTSDVASTFPFYEVVALLIRVHIRVIMSLVYQRQVANWRMRALHAHALEVRCFAHQVRKCGIPYPCRKISVVFQTNNEHVGEAEQYAIMGSRCRTHFQSSLQRPGVASTSGQSITHTKTIWRNIWIRYVFCYRIPAPLVLGVPTKTRLESSIKKWNPHLFLIAFQAQHRAGLPPVQRLCRPILRRLYPMLYGGGFGYQLCVSF